MFLEKICNKVVNINMNFKKNCNKERKGLFIPRLVYQMLLVDRVAVSRPEWPVASGSAGPTGLSNAEMTMFRVNISKYFSTNRNFESLSEFRPYTGPPNFGALPSFEAIAKISACANFKVYKAPAATYSAEARSLPFSFVSFSFSSSFLCSDFIEIVPFHRFVFANFLDANANRGKPLSCL